MTFLYISAIILIFVKVADNPEEGRTLSENTKGNKAETVAQSFDPNDFSTGAAQMGAIFGFYLCFTIVGMALSVIGWNREDPSFALLALTGCGTAFGFVATFASLFGFIGWLFGYYLAEGYDEDTDDQEVAEET